MSVTRAYITPECRTGYGKPDFKHGCPSCQYPGYQSPALGWVKVECACPHHQAGETDTPGVDE